MADDSTLYPYDVQTKPSTGEVIDVRAIVVNGAGKEFALDVLRGWVMDWGEGDKAPPLQIERRQMAKADALALWKQSTAHRDEAAGMSDASN